MNVEPPHPSDRAARGNAEEADLASLLQQAGRRPSPPADVAERIYQQAHAAWRSEVRRRARHRWLLGVAAGTAFVVVGLGALLYETPAPAVQVATIESVVSSASIGHAGTRQAATPGSVVLAGDVVETGATGAIRVRRADGLEVRIGNGSRVAWQDVARLNLYSGRLYVDSGSHGAGERALRVAIPAGVIEHLGTRYLVTVLDQAATVAVRDGRVQITPTVGASTVLSAGESAHVTVRAGIERLAASHAIEWNWADALGKPIAIDSRSVSAVLDELARADNMHVVYDGSAAAKKAREAQLHGKDLQLPPREAMRAIILTTGLTGQIEGDQMIISLPER